MWLLQVILISGHSFSFPHWGLSLVLFLELAWKAGSKTGCWLNICLSVSTLQTDSNMFQICCSKFSTAQHTLCVLSFLIASPPWKSSFTAQPSLCCLWCFIFGMSLAGMHSSHNSIKPQTELIQFLFHEKHFYWTILEIIFSVIWCMHPPFSHNAIKVIWSQMNIDN